MLTNLTITQLYALGLSSKTDVLVLGFDSKLSCLSSDILTPIITKFANASLETNRVLNDWKLSRVTPIYKGKGDVNDKGNYRPISVISHIAKIIEREIKHQMCIYLERNALARIHSQWQGSSARPSHFLRKVHRLDPPVLINEKKSLKKRNET